MADLNMSLFLTLNADAAPDPLILAGARFLATYVVGLVPLLFAIDWLRGGAERRAAFIAFMAVLLGLALNQLIGWFVFVSRPSMVGAGHTFLTHAADSSFPSDHATVIFSAAAAYRLQHRHALAFTLALAGVLVGWARVYLGVHFPADIVGAVGVAILAGVLAMLLGRRLGSPVLRLAEVVYRVLFARLIERGWARP